MDLRESLLARVGVQSRAKSIAYGGVWRTDEQFSAAVRAIDAELSSAGVGEGEPVGVFMRNRPGPVAAMTAVMATNRPLVVLNPTNPDGVVGDDVLKLRPAAVLADPLDWTRDAITGSTGEIGALGVSVDIPSDGTPGVRIIVDRKPNQEFDPVDPAVALLIPTSGTTGPPKRIPLRHNEIEQALVAAQEHYIGKDNGNGRARGAGVQIVALPPTNISGLWALITGLTGGGQLLLQDKFEPLAWSEAAAEFKPSSASLPPAALRMLLDANVDPEKLVSLKAVWAGAAPVGADLAAEFERTYDCPVLQSYGATEFTGGIAGWSLADWHRWKDTKRGSVGRSHPGVRIAVIDPDSGGVLDPGERGIIQVQSAQSSGGAFQWVRTNDLGRVDADGFVWIDGRADDVINRGGFKIFPAELEDCLESHSAVREAVAFGIDDPRLGAVPVAVVVTRGDVDSGELIAWVRSRHPGYMVPTAVRIVDSIPRNAAMKVLRVQVRDEFLREMAAERA